MGRWKIKSLRISFPGQDDAVGISHENHFLVCFYEDRIYGCQKKKKEKNRYELRFGNPKINEGQKCQYLEIILKEDRKIPHRNTKDPWTSERCTPNAKRIIKRQENVIGNKEKTVMKYQHFYTEMNSGSHLKKRHEATEMAPWVRR